MRSSSLTWRRLRPGTALEVGSGEGADAIGLAQRGWQVTAIESSMLAVHRAAERTAGAGEDVAHRIAWQQAGRLGLGRP